MEPTYKDTAIAPFVFCGCSLHVVTQNYSSRCAEANSASSEFLPITAVMKATEPATPKSHQVNDRDFTKISVAVQLLLELVLLAVLGFRIYVVCCSYDNLPGFYTLQDN